MALPNGSKNSLARAFACAFEGIDNAARGRNFKIECAIGLLAVVLGFAFRISHPEWLAVIICIGVVLGFEVANTAIESVVDLASPGYDERAKRAKDCAAGAVLVASIAALAVGIMLYAPRILALFGLFG